MFSFRLCKNDDISQTLCAQQVQTVFTQSHGVTSCPTWTSGGPRIALNTNLVICSLFFCWVAGWVLTQTLEAQVTACTCNLEWWLRMTKVPYLVTLSLQARVDSSKPIHAISDKCCVEITARFQKQGTSQNRTSKISTYFNKSTWLLRPKTFDSTFGTRIGRTSALVCTCNLLWHRSE